MIGFNEKLPTEWESKYEQIRQNGRCGGATDGTGHTTTGTTDATDTTGTTSATGMSKAMGADDQVQQSALEREFLSIVDKPELMPLLPVIQGLMRFLPATRISADEALNLLHG